MASEVVLQGRLDRMTKPKVLSKGEVDRIEKLNRRAEKIRRKRNRTANDERHIERLENIVRAIRTKTYTGKQLSKIRRLKKLLGKE